MEPARLSLILILVAFALTPPSSVVAQNSPADYVPQSVVARNSPADYVPPSVVAQDSPADYLAGHNTARKAVGVGPITWSEELAAYARNYADKRAKDCQLRWALWVSNASVPVKRVGTLLCVSIEEKTD
ncbi:hypothetical protein MLD38_022922 [Melastoma candidum]|uniref:Uncharacterized protein n=1 Tax=Melastoma candidum TaxID=119954 RepID=A0ACB9QKS3_9MYRT|nr:hypothetical protein MLD38_022922 [Melastoma candidum]